MIPPPASVLRRRSAVLTAGLALCLAAASAQEKPLVLLIQPSFGEAATKQGFQPFADYLARVTGTAVTIVTKPNFFAHWDTIRHNTGYDLVLDDAHFTDYRVQKF